MTGAARSRGWGGAVLVSYLWPTWSGTYFHLDPALQESFPLILIISQPSTEANLALCFWTLAIDYGRVSRQETSVFRYSVYTPLMECLHSLHSLTVIVKWDSKQHFLLGVDAPLYTPMTFCSHMTGNDTGWQVWSSFQASGDLFL